MGMYKGERGAGRLSRLGRKKSKGVKEGVKSKRETGGKRGGEEKEGGGGVERGETRRGRGGGGGARRMERPGEERKN